MHPAGGPNPPTHLREVVDVTVAIPSIPTRAEYLQRALRSVYAQTVEPSSIVIGTDHNRVGAARNRDLTVGDADTEWLAFLDDDDELYPDHLRLLLAYAQQTDADLVYPWFDVIGGTDPFPHHEGVPWDNHEPHQVPITFLVKTEAYRSVGGFLEGFDESLTGTDHEGNRAGEDYRFTLKLAATGKKIVHLPRRTWAWHHHSSNTMGLPTRW